MEAPGTVGNRYAARGALRREDLERLVNDGLTVRQIAASVDRSPTTVRYWLGRFDLATKSRPAKTATRTGWCEVHGENRFYTTGARTGCARCRVEQVTEWRRRTKRKLVAEAGGACRICGYDRSVGTLQFHHIDPATKRFAIGGRGLTRSIDDLRSEAARCILLCANCHSEVELGVAKLPRAVTDRG